MSNTRWDLANMTKIANAKLTMSSATTSNFDLAMGLGAINLATVAAYTPGDRILVVLSASTAGTTDSLTWAIQDAPDNAGSIGTPATALISAVSGALAATTSDDFSAFAVQLQPNRPWLRVRATSSGATDTFVCHCTVWAVPNGA